MAQGNLTPGTMCLATTQHCRPPGATVATPPLPVGGLWKPSVMLCPVSISSKAQGIEPVFPHGPPHFYSQLPFNTHAWSMSLISWSSHSFSQTFISHQENLGRGMWQEETIFHVLVGAVLCSASSSNGVRASFSPKYSIP